MQLLPTFAPEELLGWLAAGLVFLTFCMRTMLSLRLVALASNLAFIGYALAYGLTPILVLHGALLPLNALRLAQMQRQVARLAAAPADDGFGWLAPLGDEVELPAGRVLFRKGDAADRMYLVVSGRVSLPEIEREVGPGQPLGEIALFTEDARRTASAVTAERTRLVELTAERVRRLHYDNPRFAWRLSRLIASRLVDTLGAAEAARAAAEADRAAAALLRAAEAESARRRRTG